MITRRHLFSMLPFAWLFTRHANAAEPKAVARVAMNGQELRKGQYRIGVDGMVHILEPIRTQITGDVFIEVQTEDGQWVRVLLHIWRPIPHSINRGRLRF